MEHVCIFQVAWKLFTRKINVRVEYIGYFGYTCLPKIVYYNIQIKKLLYIFLTKRDDKKNSFLQT